MSLLVGRAWQPSRKPLPYPPVLPTTEKKLKKKHKFTIYAHLFVSIKGTPPLPPPPRPPLLSPFTLLFLNYNIRLKSGRPDLKMVWFSNSPDFKYYLKSGQYKSERPYFGIFKIVRTILTLTFYLLEFQ